MTNDELAMKYLLRHPNDKSDHILSKIIGSIGMKAAFTCVDQAVSILQLVDLTNRNIVIWKADVFDRERRLNRAQK